MNSARLRPVRCVMRAAAFVLTLVAFAPATPASAGDPLAMPDNGRLERLAARLAANQPLRIVAFGSSSTEGAGATSPAAAYPSRLQADLTERWQGRVRVTVLNRGIGGEDADDMAVRLPSAIAEHPDLIVWQTGSNDPLRDVPLDRFVQETRAGIAAIRAAHIDAMLMEPQLCRQLDGNPASLLYRDALRALGEEMGVPVIRRHTMMREWLANGVLTRAELLSPDGLHMADAGYAKLAEAIAADIVRRADPSRIALDGAAVRGADGQRNRLP